MKSGSGSLPTLSELALIKVYYSYEMYRKGIGTSRRNSQVLLRNRGDMFRIWRTPARDEKLNSSFLQICNHGWKWFDMTTLKWCLFSASSNKKKYRRCLFGLKNQAIINGLRKCTHPIQYHGSGMPTANHLNTILVSTYLWEAVFNQPYSSLIPPPLRSSIPDLPPTLPAPPTLPSPPPLPVPPTLPPPPSLSSTKASGSLDMSDAVMVSALPLPPPST